MEEGEGTGLDAIDSPFFDKAAVRVTNAPAERRAGQGFCGGYA